MNIPLPDTEQFKDITGSIDLPEHVNGRTFAAWWEAYHKNGKTDYEKSDFMRRWRGAHAVISGYGEFHVKGVAAADLTESGDNLPIQLMAFCGSAVDIYMQRFLDPKKWLASLLILLATVN